jgi:hypothetical protein
MRTYQLLTALTLGVIALAEHSSIATSDNQVQAQYDLPVLSIKPAATNPNPEGDVNHDGVVNAADILALFESWGACQGVGISADGSASIDGDQSASCEGDLDADQVVGELDLIIVLKSWE